MVDSNKFALKSVIELTRSSEKKFKQGNFKGAIIDKREAQSILKAKSGNEFILDKFREELSKIYSSKFDLIHDHKLRINELKKDQMVKFLEQKSEEKFKKGDYKGAIKALRRSEKYLSK